MYLHSHCSSWPAQEGCFILLHSEMSLLLFPCVRYLYLSVMARTSIVQISQYVSHGQSVNSQNTRFKIPCIRM